MAKVIVLKEINEMNYDDIWIGFPNTVWGKYVANEHQPTNHSLEQNGWHVFIV